MIQRRTQMLKTKQMERKNVNQALQTRVIIANYLTLTQTKSKKKHLKRETNQNLKKDFKLFHLIRKSPVKKIPKEV